MVSCPRQSNAQSRRPSRHSPAVWPHRSAPARPWACWGPGDASSRTAAVRPPPTTAKSPAPTTSPPRQHQRPQSPYCAVFETAGLTWRAPSRLVSFLRLPFLRAESHARITVPTVEVMMGKSFQRAFEVFLFTRRVPVYPLTLPLLCTSLVEEQRRVRTATKTSGPEDEGTMSTKTRATCGSYG